MFRQRSIIAFAAGLGLALAVNAHADHSKSLHDQFTGQNIGMAGCGLGSVVFGDKPGMIQVVAATLNATAGNQTFGISSGTSNCGQSGNSGSQARLFIEVNKHALARDVSRGDGEALQSFAKIVGCPSRTLGVELKSNYKQIFNKNADTNETTNAIFNVIHSSTQLQQCSTLG